MKDITLFLNNRKSSYDRFGEKEAPRYITWSEQNRSRLLRVPVINGKRICFILRSPDSGINPYLAFAVVIQAGLEGIRNKESLPAPLDINMRNMKPEECEKLDMLPGSLQEAVKCARESAFLQNGVCRDFTNRFIEIVENEQEFN